MLSEKMFDQESSPPSRNEVFPPPLETPEPEEKIPRPEKLPEEVPEKSPEMKSRVRSKRAPRIEDEMLMEKVNNIKRVVDELAEADRVAQASNELDTDTKWEMIDNLITLSAFIAEQEHPDDPLKQGIRNAVLMKMYIKTDKEIDKLTKKEKDKRIDTETVDWFIKHTRIHIKKILTDMENRIKQEAANEKEVA